LEECYKVLRTLHGSRYVEKFDRILDKSVHGFEPEPARSNTSQHQENVLSGAILVCGKQSTDSIGDTDSKSSEMGTLLDVNANRGPSVREQCLNLKAVDRNSRDVVKCDDKFNVTLKRHNPIHVCRRNAAGTALTCRCIPINRETCTVYAEGQPTEYSCKRSSYPNKSKYSVSEFRNSIQSITVESRRRCSCLFKTASRSVGNGGSKKHTALFENEVKISVDNNENLHISCSNNNNNDVPPNTSVISTNSHHLCIYNLSGNLTDSRTESSCAKDVITGCSVHDERKAENCKIGNSCLQPSAVQNHSVPSLGLQYNDCEKLSEQCNTVEQFGRKPVLNKPTSPVPPPLKLLVKNISLKDNLHTNGVQAESKPCTHEVNREVLRTPLNEEEKCSDRFSLLSSQLHKHGSPSSDIPSSMAKDISSIEEVAVNKSCINEQSLRHGQQIFISPYDIGCLGTLYKAQPPLQEENARMYEIYNHYEPMNESFKRNCHQLKSVSYYESLDRKVNGGNRTECGKGHKTNAECNVGDSGNAYEECKPCDTDDLNADIPNDKTLSTYDVPLYQAYNCGSVSFKLSVLIYKIINLFTITNRIVLPYI
jgi:hypothetical protein